MLQLRLCYPTSVRVESIASNLNKTRIQLDFMSAKSPLSEFDIAAEKRYWHFSGLTEKPTLNLLLIASHTQSPINLQFLY